jgi:Icc-related predicted phosphoesterase
MIRVCHFSDWHGRVQALPPADVYVCTGDMYDNFPIKDRDKGSYTYRSYIIDPKHEIELQTKQVTQFIANGGFRSRLGSPEAPIFCVRGNHDFIDLKPMFEGCDVHELLDNELLNVHINGHDLRVTGHRGIPWIFGTWNDEVQRADLVDRARRMPEADLFLTHYPPQGMLDSLAPHWASKSDSNNVGLEGMMNIIVHRVSSEYELTDDGLTPEGPIRAAHCFGHIHECGGYKTQATDVMFSNAATTFNTFVLEPVG